MDPALVERLEALGYLNDRAESAGFRPPQRRFESRPEVVTGLSRSG